MTTILRTTVEWDPNLSFVQQVLVLQMIGKWEWSSYVLVLKENLTIFIFYLTLQRLTKLNILIILRQPHKMTWYYYKLRQIRQKVISSEGIDNGWVRSFLQNGTRVHTFLQEGRSPKGLHDVPNIPDPFRITMHSYYGFYGINLENIKACVKRRNLWDKCSLGGHFLRNLSQAPEIYKFEFLFVPIRDNLSNQCTNKNKVVLKRINAYH